MARIGSNINADATFRKYREHQRTLLDGVRAKGELVKMGGGKEAIDKHRKRGKLFVRERILKLVDPGSSFVEIGLFAAYGMYEEFGGAPSSGTVFGIGKIHQRDVVIVANDATVKAGAWFPIT